MRVEARRAQAWRMTPIGAAATLADIAYVRATHATLDQLAQGRAVPRAQLAAWAGHELPDATYVLPDGTFIDVAMIRAAERTLALATRR